MRRPHGMGRSTIRNVNLLYYKDNINKNMWILTIFWLRWLSSFSATFLLLFSCCWRLNWLYLYTKYMPGIAKTTKGFIKDWLKRFGGIVRECTSPLSYPWSCTLNLLACHVFRRHWSAYIDPQFRTLSWLAKSSQPLVRNQLISTIQPFKLPHSRGARWGGSQILAPAKCCCYCSLADLHHHCWGEFTHWWRTNDHMGSSLTGASAMLSFGWISL